MKLFHLYKIAALSVLPLLLVACDSQNNGNRVSLGTANKSFSLNDIQYQEPFVVQVTDPAGDPSPNAYVELKLSPLSYNKGYYEPVDTDSPSDGINDSWAATYTISCASEDTNNNGSLDAGEDLNANGVLEPFVPAITAYPDDTLGLPTILPGTAALVTDENGFGYFSVTYPKSEALWIRLMLTAEVQDGLDGNIASYTWTPLALVEDLNDLTIAPPGGVNSPYGTTADCTSPD